MAEITKITNHQELGIADLMAQFQASDLLKASLSATCSNRFQELEDMMYEMYLANLLSSATTDTMNNIGSIIGEARNGRTNSDYARFILARTKVNECSGNYQELDEDGNLVGGLYYVISYLQNFTDTHNQIITTSPKVIDIYTDGSVPPTAEMIRQLQKSTAIGTRINNIILQDLYPFRFTEYGIAVPTFEDFGLTTGTSAFKLIQSSKSFLTTLEAGWKVTLVTTDEVATIISVDSDEQLTLDKDIFPSGSYWTAEKDKDGTTDSMISGRQDIVIDSSANFLSNVTLDHRVKNLSTGIETRIRSIDSDTQITLFSPIFTSLYTDYKIIKNLKRTSFKEFQSGSAETLFGKLSERFVI